jgi:hypothetical protein
MLDNANERSPLIDLRAYVWWNAVKHLTLWETTERRQAERRPFAGRSGGRNKRAGANQQAQACCHSERGEEQKKKQKTTTKTSSI